MIHSFVKLRQPIRNQPMKVQAYTRQVNFEAFRKQLCGNKHKLPDNYQLEGRLQVPARNQWHNEGYYLSERVSIYPKESQGIPRIFIECRCGRKIPAGRIAQHTHAPEFGTQSPS